MKIGKVFKKTAKWTGIALLFLLVLELSARTDTRFRYDAPFFGAYNARHLRAVDAEGIRRNRPGRRFEKWENNRLGFRGPEIAIEKRDGVKRIVCMGTSESYGLHEERGKEWPAQLRDRIGRDGSFDVINASTVGLPMKHFRRYLEKYVLPVDPDIVVLVINPYITIVELENYRKGKTLADQTEAMRGKRGVTRAKDLLLGLRIYSKFTQMIDRFLPAGFVEDCRRRQVEKEILAAERTRLKGEKPIDVVPEAHIETFRADLEELVDYLDGLGIDVVLSSCPTLLSEETRDKFPLLFLEYRRFVVELSLEGMLDAIERFERITRAVAGAKGAGFVDLNGAFPKNRSSFADAVHYTDEGAAIMAGTVADFIAKHY